MIRRLVAAGVLAGSLGLMTVVGIAVADVPSPEVRREQAAPSPEVAVVRQWTDFAATAGTSGIIVVLMYVIRLLWLEIKSRDAAAAAELKRVSAEKDAEIKQRDDTIATIQQKRVEEGVQNAERITTVATTATNLIAENTRNALDLTGIVRALKERSDTVGPALVDISGKLAEYGRKVDDALDRWRRYGPEGSK